ncbi:MAG TPA: 2-hydroxyglutaryl-CoA dehydratase [Clostridiales bacterium]|nr:2-hydroxyglutaryl-CoA dehydratase [Clostridiales bacterium]
MVVLAGQHVYLGIDVGSVTTKIVGMLPDGEIAGAVCLETLGQPARQIMRGLTAVGEALSRRGTPVVAGVGTTGSGRNLAAALVGGDVVKNEITAHAVAALHQVPGVRTVLEIGGQDSKVIVLRDGVVVDFAMNTVCAAGTGSFLDRQAARLGLDIREFGRLALRSTRPVRIAGRCTVFAESDMVHKQQVGHSVEDIVAGLCRALVRNYLNNLAKGKDLEPPFVFQGGVAANAGMVRAFEEALGHEVIVPEHHALMGAYGAAILAQEWREGRGVSGRRSGRDEAALTRFRGFDLRERDFRTSAFDCDGCPNECEIIEVFLDGALVARWGGRCRRWERDTAVPPA